MSYLDKYGKRSQRFQEGGPMPAGAEMAPPQQAGPAPAEGQEEQILQLAEAAVAGDQQAAAEVLKQKLDDPAGQGSGGGAGGVPGGSSGGGSAGGGAACDPVPERARCLRADLARSDWGGGSDLALARP